jgi:hypothetical protein
MGGNLPSQNSKMKRHLGVVDLSNRCVETQAQIRMVSDVIALTTSALSRFQGGAEEGKYKDRESEIALDKTLWSACERMQAILNDTTRWDDTFQRKIEKEYNELHELQMVAIDNQRKAAAEVTSPHFRYRPDLKRLVDGRWLVILGDENQLEFAVYGVGTSPQLAMESFDEAFNKGVPPAVVAWCQERETNFESGSKHTKPFPNQQTKHDDKKMDDTRNDTGNSTPE